MKKMQKIKVTKHLCEKTAFGKAHPIKLQIGMAGPTYSLSAQEAEVIASLLADAAEDVRNKGVAKPKAANPRVQRPAIVALKKELAEIVERQVANIKFATVYTVTNEIRNRRAKHLFPFAIELPKARVRYYLNQLVIDEVLHRETRPARGLESESVFYMPYNMRP